MRPGTAALLLFCASLPITPVVARAQAVASGRLEGTVFDSVAQRPLSRALLQLVSADREHSRGVIADSLGRFRADSLEPGAWVVAVVHPRLDSLGIEQLSRGIEVKRRGTTRLALGLPSARTLIARICNTEVALDSAGYLRGRVRPIAPTSDSVTGGVRLAWSEWVLEKGKGLRRTLVTLESRTNADGQFVVCGVPANVTVQLRAWRGADSTGLLELTTPAEPTMMHDFTVGPTQRLSMPAPARPDSLAERDTLPPPQITVYRGSGRLRGVARREVPVARGTRAPAPPLANARVSVWGTGLETRTDDEGRFRLDGLPLGMHMLETRAIGLEPRSTIVEIVPDSVVMVAMSLERLMLLDTVKVRALRVSVLGRDMVEFEERRRRGIGRFLSPEDLAERDPLRVSELFWTMPGVRVVPGGYGTDQILMRGWGMQPYCVPDIYIDRMRLVGETNLESLIIPSTIRAVEVYANIGTVPPEFMMSNECGAIVIWTGPRPPRAAAKPR